MHLFCRASFLVFLIFSLIVASVPSGNVVRAQEAPTTPPPVQQSQQRIVESVDIQGNRRLRDEDLLYYITTRENEPFNPRQAEADLQTLLSLNFFERTSARVFTQEGTRGGVIVIFEVTELPIIRSLLFEGLRAVTEADVLRAFRENRIGVSQEAVFDPVKARNATRLIRELLAARGFPNATVEFRREEVSATSIVLTFVVNQGERVRVVDIQFEGNTVFSDGELRRQMQYVRESGLITRFQGRDILDLRRLEEDMRRVRFYMNSKGYLQARTGEPRVESLGERRTGFFIPLPIVSSTDEALRVTIPITEGRLYRIGEIRIEGNSIFSEEAIRLAIGLRPGDVADGQRIGKALFEDLKREYGRAGFIQYTAEPTPSFRDNPQNPNEGIADFTIAITEGRQFTLRRLEFLGNTFTRDYVLRREVVVNEGDIYNQALFEYSVLRLNQLGYFDAIDKDRDVDLRTIEEEGLVDATVRVAERGRQQIAFNGGVSGIGGSFFGLEYSTNNFLGRGETLSFNLAYGNRQRSFYFSFTEPYIRNRPITAGVTVYTRSLQFLGQGTGLSQNIEALQGAFSPIGALTTGTENLFTQRETGASLFLSSPLSEFRPRTRFTQSSRVAISYSISQSSVRDPEVNQEGNAATFIPVIYRQPSILISRITPSFVYDTRDFRGTVDPVGGRQLALSLAFAGLGGDVRTYQPFATYSQFIPVRRRSDPNKPEVFAFRLLAGYIGSFAITDDIRNANSLAFVNGIPVFERFFLGDEFTIRGYEPRQISPVAPVDLFVTSRNVVLASNATGTAQPIAGLDQSLANIGLLTGASGANSVSLGRSATRIGGDTQLLGNFEYRIPLFGPVSLAAFADIGTSFNLRRGEDQFINSEFLNDDPFISTLTLPPPFGGIPLRGGLVPATLSTLAVANNQSLALSPFGGLVIRDNRIVTQEEFNNAQRVGPVDPVTLLPFGFQQAFLRGEVQSNTVVRVSQSLFSRISDYRASVGGEVRVQVPVVNVPFRLIFAYNPNARPELNERRNVFRFSIGRTF
jgi:outer membrane protein insertion porin family